MAEDPEYPSRVDWVRSVEEKGRECVASVGGVEFFLQPTGRGHTSVIRRVPSPFGRRFKPKSETEITAWAPDSRAKAMAYVVAVTTPPRKKRARRKKE